MTILLQDINQLPDPLIHYLNHGGIGCHRGYPLISICLTELVPFTGLVNDCCIIGRHSQFLLTLKSFLLELHKSNFIAVDTLLDPIRRCLNRGVWRIVREVQKEWLLLPQLRFHKLNRRIGERIGQITIGGICSAIRDMLIVFHHELGAEIVLRAPPSAVEKVETAVERE